MNTIQSVLKKYHFDKFKSWFPWYKLKIRYSTDELSNKYDQVLDDQGHDEFTKFIFQIPADGHKVFVVQPRIKWGPSQNTPQIAQYKLEEAVTLIKTLYPWTVTGTLITTVKDTRQAKFFSSVAISAIKSGIEKSKKTTALFISVNMLNALQQKEMEREFKLPVYDRYTIVLKIFSEHANTREAKTQTALAEIPYLKSKLAILHQQGTHGRESGKMQFIGGSGETFISKRKQLLLARELKLKKILAEIKEKRQLLRKNRIAKQIPVIAIVGYTNAGKTCLIKSITEDKSLEPKDQLFATLDVTTHMGKLANFHKVLFIDTIGFISDIPLDLIESFTATLEDVALADLIIHVWDVSHPDASGQKETVLSTLKQLKLSSTLLDTIIEVGNKLDLVADQSKFSKNSGFLISAKTGDGVGDLRKEIQSRVISNKGLLQCTFRVPMGGEESSFLYKFASVMGSEADEDANFLLIDCILTTAILSKFQYEYGKDLLLLKQ